MIWIFLILAVIVGWLKGGELRRLGNLNFKYLGIFILALILQYVIIFFGNSDIKLISDYMTEIYIASYILLFIGIIINIRNTPLIIVLIGSALNFFVFIMNSRNIPVSIKALELAGMNETLDLLQTGKLMLYTSLTEGTNYPALAQTIAIPEFFPFSTVFSIGDFLIALGLFVFIETSMADKRLDRKMKFGYGR